MNSSVNPCTSVSESPLLDAVMFPTWLGNNGILILVPKHGGQQCETGSVHGERALQKMEILWQQYGANTE